MAISFVFINKAVEKTIYFIEGQETISVCLLCHVEHFTGMGNFGLSYGEKPNTSDYCLTGALGRLVYAFVYSRMPFLKFPHFMYPTFIVLRKGLCTDSCCNPHPHTYGLSHSNAVHTLTLMS